MPTTEIEIPNPSIDETIMKQTLTELKKHVKQHSENIGVDLGEFITSMEDDFNGIQKWKFN